ncbi:MAG TPA: class I SAM-dependent methyltransferase [Solirubrobacteraceae bacterium]|nr:class I SAM-dependent methyltransferase [Solirubrobacteraceae bacterium]
MPRPRLDGPTLRRLGSRARREAVGLRNRIEDARLVVEQRRLVLGPAHRAWRGNSVIVNRDRWNGWDWTRAGEEWTASPEWKDALIGDVLDRLIPDRAVLVEIGPGAGRWSRALLGHATKLILVDVSSRPLDLCRREFAGAENVEYVLCAGSDLAGVAADSVDGIWSFDVFVHIAPVDQAGYLDEISRVLRPGGVAVIHHADGRNRGHRPSRHGWRAPMSRGLFAALAADRGLAVERQFDSWGPSGEFDLSAYADAFTVLRKQARV